MVRSRRIDSRDRGSRPVGPSTEEGIRPILDKEFSHYRDGMRWSFTDGKILLDGEDVNKLLDSHKTDIRAWLGIAGGIDEYRKVVNQQAREQNQFVKFEAIAEALLGKIMGHLKKVCDQKTSGLTYSIENGQLILNRINVHSFLALYRARRTEKARQFLKGIRDKLGYLLGSPEHEKIRGMVQRLYDEISDDLGKTPEDSRSPRLLSRGNPVGD